MLALLYTSASIILLPGMIYLLLLRAYGISWARKLSIKNDYVFIASTGEYKVG